jgi:GNAT superfamily N-acetyltransferase
MTPSGVGCVARSGQMIAKRRIRSIWRAVWLARTDAAVLVAERADRGRLAGFTEVGTRLYAEGCDTSPVAYLEGWYVDRDVRRHGIGAALARAAEVWAREHGYRELASDALL